MLNLKNLRKQRKLTQSDLAEIIGVSQVTMGRYETGEREMPYETLFQLADFFGVTIDEILGRVPMDVVLLKENAPPLGEDEYEIVIEPGEPAPSKDDLERRIAEIVQRELQKKGL